MLVATSMSQDSIELSVYTFAIKHNSTTLIEVSLVKKFLMRYDGYLDGNKRRIKVEKVERISK